ncbi:AAA family ATPase [Mesorhizobium sp. L2C066B000]|uniref:AAA family ATPase n=1 Tax=Mesorhizobium sp. L2C066B000 TaxID=1287105 RepID=UPI0004CFCA6D|nr:AAA family ATPase [Mesorhizobium sp. L2C066B000]
MTVQDVQAAPPSQVTVWDELEIWAKDFSPWQKLTLAWAVRYGVLAAEQIGQVYSVFLHGFGLADEPSPKLEIPATITGKASGLASQKPRLLRIHDVSGVNALTPSAELAFSPQLTLIYGGNGAGKSGFARILTNVCFSRTRHAIIPDIYDDTAPRKASATIVLVDHAGNEIPLVFDGTTEHAELKRSFAVFDSSVAGKHLSDSGPLGFKPAGFDVFPEMARVYGLLAQKLAAAIDVRPKQNRFVNAFIGNVTAASAAVAALGPKTDLVALRKLAEYGKDEDARLEEIQRLTLELQSTSPEESIRRLTEARMPVEVLRDTLKQVRAGLSKTERDGAKSLLREFNDTAKKVAATGTASFKSEKLKGAGGPEWEKLITAAYKSAAVEHDHYPNDGDSCLLCQQPLGDQAIELFGRYWEFLTSTDRTALMALDTKIKAKIKGFESLTLDIFGEDTVARTYLKAAHPSLDEQIIQLLAILKLDRDAIVVALQKAGETFPGDGTMDLTPAFEAVITKIDADIADLKLLSVADAIAKLDAERVELRHREVLSKNLDDIEKYVSDLKWCEVADSKAKPALSPRRLTEKEGELFSRVIAETYRSRLGQECSGLECAIPVEFRTKGQKGQTIRSLAIKEFALDQILSEGEQRAVALADFLTEAALNELNAGLIFDDPVNSQDHQRKERIASRLVEEAKSRQVIIFTHDLLFFTKVCGAAERAQIEPMMHWVQRGANDKPGFVSLNDAPISTPQYLKTKLAEETLAQAQQLLGSARVDLVRKGAGQLRRTIEEVVPHLLLKQVVRRWDDRIMVTALRRVMWDQILIEEIIEVFEMCSAMMEGHSHTEAGTEAPPTIEKLGQLVERAKAIITKAKPDKPKN